MLSFNRTSPIGNKLGQIAYRLKTASLSVSATATALIAVTLDDGTGTFKRVVARLPGSSAYLRQLESIGGLGSSMVIAIEAVDRETSSAVMASARLVVGVLYEHS